MLRITAGLYGEQTTWSLGEPWILPPEKYLVDTVEADGPEKVYIEQRFTGIPQCPQASRVRYDNPWAMFIAHNLVDVAESMDGG